MLRFNALRIPCQTTVSYVLWFQNSRNGILRVAIQVCYIGQPLLCMCLISCNNFKQISNNIKQQYRNKLRWFWFIWVCLLMCPYKLPSTAWSSTHMPACYPPPLLLPVELLVACWRASVCPLGTDWYRSLLSPHHHPSFWDSARHIFTTS